MGDGGAVLRRAIENLGIEVLMGKRTTSIHSDAEHNVTGIGFADGTARAPDEGCTPSFQVRLQDGVVYLNANELATLALDATRPQAGPSCRCR